MLELNVIETGVPAVNKFGKAWSAGTTRSHEWALMVRNLAGDYQRRELIVKAVVQDLQDGRTPLIVSDRRKLAEHLHRTINKQYTPAAVAYLHGDLSRKDRDEVYVQLGARELRGLVATNIVDHVAGPLHSRGFFDTIHLVTPPSISRFVQRVHALLRSGGSSPDRRHHPIVRYYLDVHPWLEAHLNKVEKKLEKAVTATRGTTP